MRRFVAILLLALFGLAAPIAAQTSLTVDTARDLVPMLVRAGQPAAAREMALALLAKDPTNVPLLLALSRAERDLGHGPASITAARAAYVAARNGEDRFAASMLMAQALSSDGRRLAAGVWLRRAADEAPTAQLRDRAIRDYRYVASRAKLGVRIDASVLPSDNVNNGPTTNSVTIGGLTFISPSAQPIAGIEARFGGDLTYRLRETDSARTTLTFGADMLRVRLGAEAATIDPSLTNADLARDALRFGLVQEWQPAQSQGSFRLALTSQRDFSAHAPVAQSALADLRFRRPFGAADSGWVGLGLRHTDRLDAAVRSYDQRRLGVGYSHALAGDRRLDVGLGLTDTNSASSAVANVETSLDFRLDLGRGAFGIGWSMRADLARATYDRPLYSPDPRSDTSIGLGVGAVLSEAAYMGFAPELTFDWSRVRSNVPSFDTESFQVGLGVVSSF